MSLLSQLLKNDVHTATAATPATPATQTPKSSKGSKSSKGANGEKETHARLLALAEAEGVDARLVHELATADMDGCTGLPDETLSAFLHARAASADRMAGRVPAGETQPIICARCGPVWSHPSVAAVLPMVDGWPRALGCPWCVVRAAGRFIPRPPVASATCMHWTPDTVNPDAGMGHCPCGHHYPGQRHTCADYRPQGQTTKETSP